MAVAMFPTEHSLTNATWDVIVIGGGPAGAAAARQAALVGLAVLLVDAKPFPREKVCGGFLNRRALHALGQLGLTQAAADTNAAAASALEVACGRQRLRLALPTGRIVNRASFDSQLLAAAQSAGAVVLTKTQALVEPTTAESWRYVTLIHAGQRTTVRARVVLCADGISRGSVRQLPEFATTNASDSRVGIGAVIADDSSASADGRVTMLVAREGYVGISRINGRQINLAAAVEPAFLARLAPAEAVATIFEQAKLDIPRGLPRANWRGTPALTSRPRHVAGERMFLIGDAGGYVEPFTGEGIAAALESAIAVMPFVKSAMRDWSPRLAVGWENCHRQIVRDRQQTSRQLAWILRRRWAAATAVSVCRLLPGMARRVIVRTTAPSDLSRLPETGQV